MATSITINDELMDKLQLESDKTGLDVADLVEKFLSDNLDEMDDEITLRDISFSQQRKEVIDYMKKQDIADALEIADALRLDVFTVNEIMAELIKQGILEEL